MNPAAPQPRYEWNALPWHIIERRVFKLQKRIYRASARGDVETVHRLQKLLMKSWSAKCLATRRVTQDNQGKKTAGIDGVKSLTPAERLELVDRLKVTRTPKTGTASMDTQAGNDGKAWVGHPHYGR